MATLTKTRFNFLLYADTIRGLWLEYKDATRLNYREIESFAIILKLVPIFMLISI